MNENVKVNDNAEVRAVPANDPAVKTFAKPKKSPRVLRRIVLMAVVPLALIVGGGWYWIHGGRYMSTDNAYVHQDEVSISPEVSGRVKQVMVQQDQMVKKGDVLFTIDDATYKIAVEKAESAVASARMQVGQLRAAWSAAKAKVESEQENLAYNESMVARQEKLRATGINTQSVLDSSQHDLNQARQTLVEAEQSLATAKAALDGNPDIPTDSHPVVLAALAALDQAKLDLSHAVIKAPVDGAMAQTSSLQAGSFVQAGTALAAIVTTDTSWVEANFNETDLEHIKPGDPATLTVDAYPDTTLKATVESIGAGTGATFSLLPAQNATGNWVKVVQRVPVRLKILDGNAGVTLRAGLSVSATVDTGHVRGLPPFLHSALAMVGLASEANAHEHQ
jgi:membrane fusion protein, multidrug efflux system